MEQARPELELGLSIQFYVLKTVTLATHELVNNCAFYILKTNGYEVINIKYDSERKRPSLLSYRRM